MTATWTREPPQADGYFWFRWDHDFVPAVVKVYGDQGCLNGTWQPLAILTGEWHGPLVPPEKSESP